MPPVIAFKSTLSDPDKRSKGTIHADTFHGSDGADIFQGGAGDDVIKGGAGDDTAIYDGNRTDYDVTVNPESSRSRIA